MKVQKQITLIAFLFISLVLNAFVINNFSSIPDNILKAFKTGDSKALSVNLSTNVEMAILDNEEIYSKAQAIQVLNSFFEKYPVKNFNFIHKGGKEGSKYAIGEYLSNAKKFRITIYLKNINNKPIIHQIRIQYDNNK
ncbi:DUF4783 domain-containing protein [Bacteroidota bacterium]